MGLKNVAGGVAATLVLYGLFFFGMSERGLVSADEPRYASIARTMADSGDWITPTLRGEPWFEKPALLYWLGAAADRLGIDDDRATRIPVALISVAFLVYFHRHLQRHFGSREAGYATVILATSAGWVAYSQTGVFDLPLAASLGAALLSLLPWVSDPGVDGRRVASRFGLWLGFSVLAKGLVGPVLAALALLGVAWERGVRSTAREILGVRFWIPFLAVSLPWYLLCFARNGLPFLEEFVWKHHFGRFVSGSLQHVEPFWFFLPVILIGLLPWTPLLALCTQPTLRRDRRTRFFLVWALTTLAFFSLSTNKLPGYILPALPPLAALLGVALASAVRPRWALTASALLLTLVPVTEQLLPQALDRGLGRVWPPDGVSWPWIAGVILLAVAVGWAATQGKRTLAFGLLAAAATVSFVHMKLTTFPHLDSQAGVRPLWREVRPHLEDACLGEVRRHVDYGLAYYSADRLANCASKPANYRIEGHPPRLLSPQTER
jgi:4-amino-4-deoxy-L-arabinose transferase-like glycosyltransferase